MSNVFVGIGVHWGVGSTTCANLGTCIIKSRDFGKEAKLTEFLDGYGQATGLSFSNPKKTATLEYMPTSATVNGVVTPTIAEIGDKITITDSVFTQIAGTNWYVLKVSVKNGQEDAMVCVCEVSSWSGIS